jgi:hypothetical protein
MRRGPAFTLVVALCAACVLPLCSTARAQNSNDSGTRHPLDVPDPSQREQPQRQRLILKDGTFQLVLSYKVVGSVVRYRSAERGGEQEEVPLALVDLPATERWKREHEPGAQNLPPVLSPELAREEAARAARTPFVAPDLRLPEEDSVLALDNFQATPELVPLPQQASDLNKETAHAVQKFAINPASSAHRIADLRSNKADVQLHVADPVFYVRIGSDTSGVYTGEAITVDTHGASGRDTPGGGSPNSDYVIERIDVRYDSRVVDSFRIMQLGTGKPQRDVIEMKSEPLPGGQWLKLTPVTPLEFGEYALIEVLSSHELNLDVWDFGIHPTAPENVEAQHPEVHRAPSLNHRP